MKRLSMLPFAVVATAAFAQNSTDDQPAQELWWDRVGAGFFNDATMQTLRSADEIRAQLTGLSAEDRAQLLARCKELKRGASTTSQPADTGSGATGDEAVAGAGAQAQQSDKANTPTTAAGGTTADTTGAFGSGKDPSDPNTTITGDAANEMAAGGEPQVAAQSGKPIGQTGLGSSSASFTRVCDTVATF